MEVKENISLRPFNTFGIDVQARYFGSFHSVDELLFLLNEKRYAGLQHLVLGGGSNILLTKDIDGLVLKNDIGGIELVDESDDHFFIRAGAGENWHGLVMYCVENNYAGIENLSLIPGNVGAAPMQNIGAYGVEIKDIFHDLDAIHKKERTFRKFELKDCGFGYRESVFKNRFKDQYIITHVTFRLNKIPVFNTSYGALKQELDKSGETKLTVKSISDAVIAIRSSKLPDPRVTGNAGSFFKNPQISHQRYSELKEQFPEMPSFPVDDKFVKVPAGWLIEQCGWKGYRNGDAGCYPKQALVLVNYGNAKGMEIFKLSEEIIESVNERFNIQLDREVNVVK